MTTTPVPAGTPGRLAVGVRLRRPGRAGGLAIAGVVLLAVVLVAGIVLGTVDLGPMTAIAILVHRAFGIDLGISKANRTRFHSGASNHAMALMGVDLAADGQPRKWLVENSWGDEKGDKGRWTLHDNWFDEHVYTIIVHRRHVPESILMHFNQDLTVLAAWYPGAQCSHSASISA